MLFYLSTTGEAPYGGRSSQNNHNEASIAVICEYEARRYARLGQYRLAGAFKRAAHKAVLSIKRFLEITPFRNTKNFFAPEKQHGRESGYGYYGVYSLLAASQLGIAGMIADDSIAESRTPQESSGYVLQLSGAFHKTFASAAGYHLEIDANLQFTYDALGLGRIHRAGLPTELGLSTGIVSLPDFLPHAPVGPRNIGKFQYL